MGTVVWVRGPALVKWATAHCGRPTCTEQAQLLVSALQHYYSPVITRLPLFTKINSVLQNVKLCTGNARNFREEEVFSNTEYFLYFPHSQSKCNQGTIPYHNALHKQFMNNLQQYKKKALSCLLSEMKESYIYMQKYTCIPFQSRHFYITFPV